MRRPPKCFVFDLGLTPGLKSRAILCARSAGRITTKRTVRTQREEVHKSKSLQEVTRLLEKFFFVRPAADVLTQNARRSTLHLHATNGLACFSYRVLGSFLRGQVYHRVIFDLDAFFRGSPLILTRGFTTLFGGTDNPQKGPPKIPFAANILWAHLARGLAFQVAVF